jgi:hypothetical protein
MHYIFAQGYIKIYIKIAATLFQFNNHPQGAYYWSLAKVIITKNNQLKYVVLDCSEMWLHIMSSSW